MAKVILTNAFVSISANDISDHCSQVTLDYSADVEDVTAFADLTHINLGGLFDWTISIDLFNDFVASAEDSILFPLVGTSVAMILRADAGAIDASNPQFNGTGILQSYPVLSGGVGSAATATINIVSAGTLTRTTS